MEEVDNIILHFLRQLHIHIDDEIKQLSELPVDTIITSISKCLSTINPLLKLSQKLPNGISHKIEVAAQLASLCKDMGYKNEVGYQTFLYYNETDLRQVFMFLIERLPAEGKQPRPTLEPSDRKSLLHRDIRRKIYEELNRIWTPPCCNNDKGNIVGDFIHPEGTISHKIDLSENATINLVEKLRGITGLAKPITNTSIQSTETENHDLSDCSEQTEINTTKTLKQLKEEVLILKQKLVVIENERNAAHAEYLKVSKSCDLVERELSSVQNIIKNSNISIDDSVDDIINKIRTNVNTLHNKSESLTSQSFALKTEIATIKNNLPQSQKNECKKTLISLKETAKVLKAEFNDKENLREQLKKEFDKLSRGNKRSAYTKRILEIISNVDKQTLEIKKILEDTRELQKEINTLEGQLDRCFSAADETLFKDAKKDDQAKKAYKLLALLHSECNTIVSLVNDTGTIAREIVDLEDYIKTEKSKQTEETLRRMQIDLMKMQQET